MGNRGRLRTLAALHLVGCLAMATPSPAQLRPAAVYVSADMEGVAGLSSTDDPLGRALMTEEVNAAVQGAFAAGAVRVVVNDAHGSHQNLLQDRLDQRVTLIRGDLKPYGMMQGLDSTFTAVVFVGYHGKANSTGGFAAHTGSDRVADLRINGVSVGEGGMNALYAAWYGVPVVFVAGDSLAIAELRQLAPGIAGGAVKTGIWNRAVRTASPDSARAIIRRGVEGALRGRAGPQPNLAPPFVVELQYRSHLNADVAEGLVGVRRTAASTVAFTADRYPDAYRMIRVLYKHIQP